MVFERLAKPWPARVSGFESRSLRICCGVGSNGQGICLQSSFLLVRIQYPTPLDVSYLVVNVGVDNEQGTHRFA